jgi:hypothetical protein
VRANRQIFEIVSDRYLYAPERYLHASIFDNNSDSRESGPQHKLREFSR